MTPTSGMHLLPAFTPYCIPVQRSQREHSAPSHAFSARLAAYESAWARSACSACADDGEAVCQKTVRSTCQADVWRHHPWLLDTGRARADPAQHENLVLAQPAMTLSYHSKYHCTRPASACLHDVSQTRQARGKRKGKVQRSTQEAERATEAGQPTPQARYSPYARATSIRQPQYV